MVERTLVGITQDAIIDAEQRAHLDGQAGFLESFANRRLAQGFAQFEHPSWDGPLSRQRGISALYQHDAVAIDDDPPLSYQRVIRIFTFHAVRNPRASLNHARDSKQAAGGTKRREGFSDIP